MTARRAAEEHPPPVELLDIVGQNAAVSRLQRAMAGTRMPQSPELKYRWAIEYTIPQPFNTDSELFLRYDSSYTRSRSCPRR